MRAGSCAHLNNCIRLLFPCSPSNLILLSFSCQLLMRVARLFRICRLSKGFWPNFRFMRVFQPAPFLKFPPEDAPTTIQARTPRIVASLLRILMRCSRLLLVGHLSCPLKQALHDYSAALPGIVPSHSVLAVLLPRCSLTPDSFHLICHI